MARLQYFFLNAGIANCIRLALLAVILLFALQADFQSGLWVMSLPAFAIGLTIPFFSREAILRQFSIVRAVMNIVAFGGIIFAAFLRKGHGFEPAWLRILLAFVIAFYISAYFWILSDEQIEKR